MDKKTQIPQLSQCAVICCANCGDTCNEEGFSPPENCEWFCCVDCYEEYNDTDDL
jgi:hypothetical protein